MAQISFPSTMRSLRAGINLLKHGSSPPTSSSYQGRMLSTSPWTLTALKESFLQATGARISRTVVCRTSRSDPGLHSPADHGLFYTVPDSDINQYLFKTFSTEFKAMTKAFSETALMVREPALEVLECLKGTNYGLPINRYLLFGRDGCGKTSTLAHLIHYSALQGWVIVHHPWAAHLNRYFREGQQSSTDPEYYDQPLDAIEWLSYFKKMNGALLQNLDLKMTSRYVWSKRESSEVDSPLLDTVEFGIARSKYACDVVGAVLTELKTQAAGKGFNVLVAIDGVNAFWETSELRREDDKTYVEAEKLSLVKHFMKLLENDWAGGAAVCTVDTNAGNDYKNKAVFTPRALLQRKGFEFLDPFIPIHVPDYSDKEAHSCLEYFIDRHWIQNPKGVTDEGKQEILHLSCKNPRELYNVTKTW